MNSPPQMLWAQLTAKGNPIAYARDPREVHDNGQPVYRYRLERNNTEKRKETVRVVEGRPRSKRKDWNAFAWRPVETVYRVSNARQAMRLHRETRPKWEFRIMTYVRQEAE